MPRSRPPDRLEQLVDAGLRVFARKGLERARMSDVAKEMGVSQGTLYNTIESKEALFYLIVERGLSEDPPPPVRELPIRAPSQRKLMERLKEQIASWDFSKLEAALKRRRVDDARAELAGILVDFYDATARSRLAISALERSAIDMPEMFSLFFTKMRRSFFAMLTNYVDRRMKSGHFRQVPDASVAARYIVETITWFARHRHADPDPVPWNDAAVRETTIALIMNSLLEESER